MKQKNKQFVVCKKNFNQKSLFYQKFCSKIFIKGYIFGKNFDMKILKRLSLANILDFCIINFSIFLITFAWTKFWSKSTSLSIIVAILFCVIITILGQVVKNKKNTKYVAKKEDAKNIERLSIFLLTCSKEEVCSQIKKLLLTQNSNIKDLNYDIIINDGEFLLPMFEDLSLSFEKAIKNIKKAVESNVKVIKILCIECDYMTKKRLESIENIKVEVKTKNEIYYQIFRSKIPVFDKEIKFADNKKYRFKELVRISLAPEKSKKYFVCGIFIFLCSIVVRYNIYYVFMSSLLFLLAILSRKNKQKTAS
jgi:hypothetical protein